MNDIVLAQTTNNTYQANDLLQGGFAGTLFTTPTIQLLPNTLFHLDPGAFDVPFISTNFFLQEVSVASLGANELLNGGFDQGTFTGSQWTSFNSIPGWTTVAGSHALEVVNSGYSGINATSGAHWLDTQASPGSIDIKQTFNANAVNPATITAGHNAGDNAVLSFDIAKENIGGQMTTPDQHVEFILNGHIVEDVKFSDITTAANAFQHFSIGVNVNAGVANTLEIESFGNSNVGFALDTVGIQQYATAHALV